MSDKVEAIQQAKEIQELEKQEEKREAAKEKAEAAVAAQQAQKPGEKKAEAAKAEKKVAKKLVLDRVLVVPLMDAYKKSRSHRGRRAMSLLKAFIARHAKTAVEDVRVATEINSAILARGSRNPPKRVRVRVAKDDSGIASVTLVVDEAVKKAGEAKAVARKAKKAARRAASKAAARPASKPAVANAARPAAAKEKPAVANAARPAAVPAVVAQAKAGEKAKAPAPMASPA